jgi:hypothetical protein
MVETDLSTVGVGKQGLESVPVPVESRESLLQKHYASGGYVEDVDKTTTVKESQARPSPGRKAAVARGQCFHSGSAGSMKSEGLRLN